jgi:hypothetical protein
MMREKKNGIFLYLLEYYQKEFVYLTPEG